MRKERKLYRITEVSIICEDSDNHWVRYLNNGEPMEQFRSTLDSAYKLYEIMSQKEVLE